jgi:hypothetical protein
MSNGIRLFARIRSARRQILVLVQRLAVALFSPNQQTDKSLLRHAISRLLMESAELRDAY